MPRDQKKETEVEKDRKKRKVVIKNVTGTEEEKEMMTGVKAMKEGTETGNEEEIKMEKEREKQTDVKEAKIETPAERGGKRGNGRIGTEVKKSQRAGRETRSENDGKKKTEIDWIKKIKILIKMKGGEVIDMTRKIEILIEGGSAQKMR